MAPINGRVAIVEINILTLTTVGTLRRRGGLGSAACCNSATLAFTPSFTFCSTRVAILASWSLITAWTTARVAGSSPASPDVAQPDRPTAQHCRGHHHLQLLDVRPPLPQLQLSSRCHRLGIRKGPLTDRGVEATMRMRSWSSCGASC